MVDKEDPNSPFLSHLVSRFFLLVATRSETNHASSSRPRKSGDLPIATSQQKHHHLHVRKSLAYSSRFSTYCTYLGTFQLGLTRPKGRDCLVKGTTRRAKATLLVVLLALARPSLHASQKHNAAEFPLHGT